MIPRRLLLVLLLLALLTPPVPAQKGTSISSEIPNGLTIVTIPTPWGEIKILLPYDIRGGDTISGTVMTQPAGQSDKEKRRDANELNGCVIEVGAQRWPVSGGTIGRLAVPIAPAQLDLILRDGKGKKIDSAPLRVMNSAPSTPINFIIPQIGQTGRPIEIIGPFDGDSANTRVSLGETTPTILAESPRGAVIQVPGTVVGPNDITVSDQSKNTTGDFRALKIDLTAPKTSLLKGESTELHVQVQGLQGITQPIPIQIQNQTPQNINITGGNTQNILINPSQVTSGGTFNWNTTIAGTGSGGFHVTGTIPSTPSTMPSPSPVSSQPTATPTPAPTLPPPSVAAVPPAPSPSPVTAVRNTPQVFPTSTDDERFGNSFTKEDTDCCKKFLNNGAFEISDGKGNSFRVFRNTLSMKIDGQDYEWQFTQDGKPFYIEYMFCHLNDHMIISQLSQVMIQRVKGGNSSEAANSTNISLHGPYRDEKSIRPSYGLLFTAMKVGTNTKEYSISFTMDAEFCTWSCQLIAEDKTEEFRTAPPRSAATVYNALSQANGLPTGLGDYQKSAWWNGMYSYFFEISDTCRWYRYQHDERGMADCERAYLLWRARLMSVLGQMRQGANADDRRVIDNMTNTLQEEHPGDIQLLRIQEAFDNLHLKYGTKVPPEIRNQILNRP